jgi:hypothetical protein
MRTAHAALHLLIASLALAGCQNAKIAEPLTQKLAGNDTDAQMEFWHTLASRPLCSNDEAFHGLLLFLDQSDPANDYPGRVDALKSRGLVNKGFSQPADQAVQRGTLATALVRALKIKGGVFQRLTRDHERYAVRELMYMDLYPPSSPHQTFSGAEFLGIIGRIEDYQRGNPADYPAAVLPGEAAEGNVPKGRPRGRRRPAVLRPGHDPADHPSRRADRPTDEVIRTSSFKNPFHADSRRDRASVSQRPMRRPGFFSGSTDPGRRLLVTSQALSRRGWGVRRIAR